jgi:hypothetical protein
MLRSASDSFSKPYLLCSKLSGSSALLTHTQSLSQSSARKIQTSSRISLAIAAEMVARKKRAVPVNRSSPLDNDGILRNVLGFVGHGHFLYIGVCRAWSQCYEGLDSISEGAPGAEQAARGHRKHVHTSTCTTCKAVFASPARVRYAFEYACISRSPVWQAAAGTFADISSLQAALDVDVELQLSTAVLHGIALSSSMPKLAWARKQLGRGQRLPDDITQSAAAGGSVAMLRSLVRAGYRIDSGTSCMAAANGHIAVLNYLRSRGCAVDTRSCSAAAGAGHLAVLQWLQEHGYDIDLLAVADAAASCKSPTRSVAVLQWVQQQHQLPNAVYTEFDEPTLAAAAGAGNTAALLFLLALGCPMDEQTTEYAVESGSFDTVRLLHEHGCPWSVHCCEAAATLARMDMLVWLRERGCEFDAERCCTAAAHSCSVPCMEYCLQASGERPYSAVLLSSMLRTVRYQDVATAGAAAAWLRQLLPRELRALLQT